MNFLTLKKWLNLYLTTLIRFLMEYLKVSIHIFYLNKMCLIYKNKLVMQELRVDYPTHPCSPHHIVKSTQSVILNVRNKCISILLTRIKSVNSFSVIFWIIWNPSSWTSRASIQTDEQTDTHRQFLTWWDRNI